MVVKLYYVPGSCGDELITACDESYAIDQDFINRMLL